MTLRPPIVGILLLAGCFSQPPAPPAAMQPYGESPRRLAAGGKHACWIADNAVLYCWGDNSSGQLGVPVTSVGYSGVPLAVGLDVGWADVATGSDHTCGILGGVVTCFGANDHGQSGGPQPTNQLYLPNPATRVFAGDAGSCAIDTTGALYCWGHIDNQTGDLAAPTQLTPGGATSPWASVAIAYEHACAHRADDGTVLCWGDDDQFQLGQADQVPRTASHAEAATGGAYSAIAAADAVSCGVVADGSLACWGTTSATTVGATPYHLVDNASDTHRTWTAIALDEHHLCGVADGHLYCYGDDDAGDLGHGDFVGLVSVPGPVVLSDAVEIAVGTGFSCAASRAGEVRCWGSNQVGELGNGDVASEHDPFHVPLPAGTVNSLAVGGGHTCASVGSSGDVYCWGDNRANQVGAAGDFVLAPVRTHTNKDLLAAGGHHTCSRDLTSMQIVCWGDNTKNQAPSSFAVMPTPGLAWPPALVAGDDVTCTTASGDVFCFGALPGGTMSPTTIGGSADNSVAVGTGPIIAYIRTGTAGNTEREFGTDCATGLIDVPPTAVAITNTTATAVFAAQGSRFASGHVCAFMPSGTATTGDIACWGTNESGQVSGSNQACVTMMVEPPPPQGGTWTADISLGGSHSCAIASDGTLYGWGDNSDNSLATASTLQTRIGPTVIDATGWSIVATGPHHTCAITKAGTDVYCWGLDRFGEVGNGKMFSSLPPQTSIAFAP